MLNKIFAFLFLFPSVLFAQPLENNIQEIELFFGQITELECCSLIDKGTKAPYRGFLLSPYQLVFLKDAIDNWDADLQLQLDHVNQLCDAKLNLCQTNRNDLLDQVKIELSNCIDVTSKIHLENQALLETNSTLKVLIYTSIPLSLILGMYLGTKF